MASSVTAVKVNLVNGSYNYVRYDHSTDIQSIVGNLCRRLNFEPSAVPYFALAISHSWLSGREKVAAVAKSVAAQPCLELRVRYFPRELAEFYRQTPRAFGYLFDQAKEIYLNRLYGLIDLETAVHLGGILISGHVAGNPSGGRVKSVQRSRRQIDVSGYVPRWLTQHANAKSVRKSVFNYAEKYAILDDLEFMLKFVVLLHHSYPLDREVYQIKTQAPNGLQEMLITSSTSVTLLRNGKTIRVIMYSEICDVQSNPSDNGLTLTILPNEQVNMTCRSQAEAKNLLTLLQAYCDTDRRSAFNGHNQTSYSLLPTDVVGDTSSCGDEPLLSNGRTVEVNRSQVEFISMLGCGYFGEVHKATYKTPTGAVIFVAVKSCKAELEEQSSQEFLREAETMQNLDHPHIVKLVGVSSVSPKWILMEFAEFGELRKYLHVNRFKLRNVTLTLFCYQLAMALSYLHSKRYVHRDIAARNVLVYAKDCVKLSDFGLTISASTCTSEKSLGKLPIKWMAPESISSKIFTTQSDVWMLGVCTWEIASYGEKPFVSLRNQDIYKLLVRGDRLSRPAGCPLKVYDLMVAMWQFSPDQRPDMAKIQNYLREVHLDELEAGNCSDTNSPSRNYSQVSSYALQHCVGEESLDGSFHQSNDSNTAESSDFPGHRNLYTLVDCMSSFNIEDALALQRKQIEDDALWLENEEKIRAIS